MCNTVQDCRCRGEDLYRFVADLRRATNAFEAK